MTRCPVCDGVGFGGVTCARCHGKRFRTESNPCPCCNANGAPKGGFLSLLGHWSICRLCQGLKYLTEQPLPCPKCNATGEGSFLRIFRMTCDLCEGRRYVLSRHKPCIKCPSSSFFFICINCNGINCNGTRYSLDPQYLCPRCDSTGHLGGDGCTLCSGHGVIHHDVTACSNCHGSGEVRGALSLLLGAQVCPTCQGQGYFATYNAHAPASQPRTRESEAETTTRRRVARSSEAASPDRG